MLSQGQEVRPMRDLGSLASGSSSAERPIDCETPRETEDKTRVKKCRILSDSIYIRGSIEGEDMVFTADTGSSRTVFSSKVFNRVRQDKRPELEGSACLRGAGGSRIQEYGKAKLR